MKINTFFEMADLNKKIHSQDTIVVGGAVEKLAVENFVRAFSAATSSRAMTEVQLEKLNSAFKEVKPDSIKSIEDAVSGVSALLLARALHSSNTIYAATAADAAALAAAKQAAIPLVDLLNSKRQGIKFLNSNHFVRFGEAVKDLEGRAIAGSIAIIPMPERRRHV